VSTLSEDVEHFPPSTNAAENAWAHEVIGTYTAHLKRGAEGRAFAEAVRVYQARHPDALDKAARRAVAALICNKL
jgi:hypothetical protein